MARGSWYNEVEIRVLNGFPVIARYHIYPAEPDVGIMSEYIDANDVDLLTMKGKPASFLEKKVNWDKVVDAIWAAIS